MANNTDGIIRLKIRANFIQVHSINELKKLENIPVIPITTDTNTAHFHEKIRYRIKNPMEITKIVDFDESFFTWISFRFKIVCK